MFDYNLVTAKATYRRLTRDDIPVLTRFVKMFYAETRTRERIDEGKIAMTIQELGRSARKGTILIIEQGELPVGYCILVNYWSNELGGNVLCVDELYLLPGQRRKGIASDLLHILAEAAPNGSVAIQAETPRSNKSAVRLYRKMGFVESESRIMMRRTNLR
jgi:ribosomal protein S18 acetylase RimI-like enzyme